MKMIEINGKDLSENVYSLYCSIVTVEILECNYKILIFLIKFHRKC